MLHDDVAEQRKPTRDARPVSASTAECVSELGDGPVARTGRWLDEQLGVEPVPPLLIVIGLGAGHLLEVLERRAPETRVVALEPYPAPAQTARARRVCTQWQRDGRLVRLVGPDFAGADEAWRLFPPTPTDFKLLVDPSLTSRGSESALHAAQVAKRIVFGAKANANARRQFAPRYLTNTIRNASALVAGSDIRALRDAYRGIPAVITAAGPSLDNALDPLRDLRDRGLLIACDTTLRPLIANGVTPQLVVGADPGERNARHFQAVGDCHDTWLVAESALDPSVAPRFGNRSFWFRVADHHPWPWYRELGIDVGTVEVWGSVLTAAFQVAILAGCDPIVLVGADFSWTDGRPYARGTTYEFDWAYSAAIGNDLRDAWQQTSSGTTMTRGPTRPRDSHDSSPASLSGLDAHTGGSKRPSRDQRERGRHLLRQRRQAIIPWQGPQ